MNRSLFTSVFLAAAVATPATAFAADLPIVTDPLAQQVTVLDRSVVWVSGAFGHQKLMRRTADGAIGAVKGTTEAVAYSYVDLGHDEHGKLVLTYQRCASTEQSSCAIRRDDLDGHRASFHGLTRKRCTLDTAPALWGKRAVYGLGCAKGGIAEIKRSGLYVKRRGSAPRRLALGKHEGASNVQSVNLRGTRAAGLLGANAAQIALSETVFGTARRSFVAALSEGDVGQDAHGPELGASESLWTLTNSQHEDEPLQTFIKRLVKNCLAIETLESPPRANPQTGYRATDLAVDGHTVYLLVPGSGIVKHVFAPSQTCAKP